MGERVGVEQRKRVAGRDEPAPSRRAAGPARVSMGDVDPGRASAGAARVSAGDADPGRLRAMPAGRRAQAVGGLQQLVGNRQVQRLLAADAPGGAHGGVADADAGTPAPGPATRPATGLTHGLRVSEPHDPAEREAHQVAAEVTGSGSRPATRAAGPPAHGGARPQSASAAQQARIRSSLAGGSPLPESTRSFYESRLGSDFSDVRIHRGKDAEEAARSISAQAFTLGRHVVFGKGSYRPQSAAGRRLLAHELTHTMQQADDRSTAARMVHRQADEGAGDADDDEQRDWTEIDADDRFVYVMTRLVEQYGYPENGAAGLVGNLWAESWLLPQAVEGARQDAPMRALAFGGGRQEFTAAEVMNRNFRRQQGPRLPGVGLAQWTFAPRRAAFFQYEYEGERLGADMLFNMDAQIDYLDHELQNDYRRVYNVLTADDVTLDDASDEVVYNFERPGSVLDDNNRLRPRADPQVQRVFRARRAHGRRALRLYRAAQ